MKSTRFIKYSEPNDEPKEHHEAKFHIHTLLGRQGYILLSNVDKWEYQLEPHKTELDGMKEYTIDILMHDPKLLRLIAVEINGAYHYANKTRIGKTKQKLDELNNYFSCRSYVELHQVPYRYKTYKVHAFKTEEVVGKYKLSDDYIVGALVAGMNTCL